MLGGSFLQHAAPPCVLMRLKVKGVLDHVEEGVEESDLLRVTEDHHVLGGIFCNVAC